MEQVESNIVQENAQDQTVESSDIQADIFEQVFNPSGQDPFAVEANSEEVIQQEVEPVTESEPVSTPDTIKAKEDDSQFNYDEFRLSIGARINLGKKRETKIFYTRKIEGLSNKTQESTNVFGISYTFDW